MEGVKEKLKGMGSETMMKVMKQLQVKVKEMIADILIGNVVEKLKFQDWVLGYKHYFIVLGSVFLLFLGCCYCCYGCAGSGGHRGKPARMMKAPGRGGRIVRAEFEKNPKTYFKSLRMKQV